MFQIIEENTEHKMGARKQDFNPNDSDYLSKRARNNEAVKRYAIMKSGTDK